MRVLVTGAAGSIGSHLSKRLLKDGHEVFGVDDLSNGQRERISELLLHEKFRFHQFKFGNTDIDITGTDWVFHLAAHADIVPSIKDPIKYHESNVNQTAIFLKKCADAKVKRFIYAASSSCYGIPDKWPTTEDSPCGPMYPYALTKYIAEQYVMHWGQVYGLPVMSLRLFNVYGPNFRTSGTYGAVFGVFLAQLANQKPLTVVGDGNQSRDFTYVSDVVNAFILAAESKYTNEIINIGSGTTRSINTLVKLLGANHIVYLPKRPGEPDVTYASIAKAQRLLNYFPEVSLEEGVLKMLKNLHQYKDAPLWDEHSIKEATKEWFENLRS